MNAEPMGRPGEDPAMRLVIALFKQSGLSLTQLGERMGYSKAVARQAAWQFMKSKDPRIGMLRKFAGAMDVKLEDLTPRRPKVTTASLNRKRVSRKQLVAELELYAIALTPEDFREYLLEQLASMYPLYTIDGLRNNPQDAIAYCGHIRRMLNCPEAKDEFILRNLENQRKRGQAS